MDWYHVGSWIIVMIYQLFVIFMAPIHCRGSTDGCDVVEFSFLGENYNSLIT